METTDDLLSVSGSSGETAAGSTSSVSPSASVKRSFPPPADVPTQDGPCGLKFDFNLGARVLVPEGQWRVQLRDLDTGNILFDQALGASFVSSTKRYFCRIRIEVRNAGEIVLTHDYSAEGREVLIQFPVGTLGDILAWFSYAVRFGQQHRCKLTCAMGEVLIPLFRDAYPSITFITHDEVRPSLYYATYCLGLFFDDKDGVWQPTDFRFVGLHRTAGYILGVDPREEAPRVVASDDSRPMADAYAVIAVQSTSQAKYWNNPDGWRAVVGFLKAQGLRVVCIDQKPVHGGGIVWTHIPHGVEDETGDRPLAERVRWLRHATVFVGLSSGLSWLAWAAGARIVMISGFSHPTNEFDTPWRIINYHACNSCWNDVRHRFDHADFLWCPRHAGTPRQFECTKLITAEQVIAAIRQVPGITKQAEESPSSFR